MTGMNPVNFVCSPPTHWRLHADCLFGRFVSRILRRVGKRKLTVSLLVQEGAVLFLRLVAGRVIVLADFLPCL